MRRFFTGRGVNDCAAGTSFKSTKVGDKAPYLPLDGGDPFKAVSTALLARGELQPSVGDDFERITSVQRTKHPPLLQPTIPARSQGVRLLEELLGAPGQLAQLEVARDGHVLDAQVAADGDRLVRVEVLARVEVENAKDDVLVGVGRVLHRVFEDGGSDELSVDGNVGVGDVADPSDNARGPANSPEDAVWGVEVVSLATTNADMATAASHALGIPVQRIGDAGSPGRAHVDFVDL